MPKKYCLVFLGTMFVTRVSTLLMYGFYSEHIEVAAKSYNDIFHHYQLGLVLIILYLFLRGRFVHAKYILAVGLGLLIEEYAVILYQLGIPHFHYLSIPEIALFLFLSVGTLLWCLLAARKK